MCVCSLSTRLHFLLPEYPRYLFPDIVLTTRKPINSSLWLILPIPPSHVLQGVVANDPCPRCEEEWCIVFLQDSLMEGCLGWWGEQLRLGMELRDSDELVAASQAESGEARKGQRWTRIWRALVTTNRLDQADVNEWTLLMSMLIEMVLSSRRSAAPDLSLVTSEGRPFRHDQAQQWTCAWVSGELI